MENILKGTNAGTWEWNVQTGETIFNERWFKIVGYTLEELSPVSIDTWKQLAHPDDLKQSDELLNQHFSGKLPYYDYECRVKHKDGHWIWVHDCGRIITWTEEGNPLMMFGTHRDITQRKFAEKLVRESEARIRSITECAQDAIIMMGSNGQVTFWNPAAERMFGYTSEEAIGQDLHHLIAPERYHEAFKAGYSKFILNGQGDAIGKTLDLTARLRNGKEITVSLSLSNLYFRNFWHAVGIIRDVTELRRMERFKDDVERIIRHDLRSPLGGIINILSIVEGDNLHLEQIKMLKLVESSGRKMLKLINDSLDMHKIEAGIYQPMLTPCDPFNLVTDNADILAMNLRINRDMIHIQNRIDVHENKFSVLADNLLLDLVVMNLMKNALEANDPGMPVIIDMSVEQHDLVLSFSNSRPVPVEVRDRFFEKYASAGKKGGTGLGTYSAFIMTRAMGGTIDMETSDETGTKVTVRIPVSPRNVSLIHSQ